MGIQTDKLPHEMSLAELSDRCKIEVGKYSRRELHDDRYCLEIFHRAISQRDTDAWELLQRSFGGMVLGWVRRHTNREAAYQYDTEDNYVAQTFARFWLAVVYNHELQFTSLAAALRYLQATLNGVILDTLRSYSRAKAVPLPEPGFAEEPAVEDHDDGRDFWDVIESMLSDSRERTLAYLLYHCGLKPREIVERRAYGFDNVQEIYRLRRNILERLTRNKERLRWLLSDE